MTVRNHGRPGIGRLRGSRGAELIEFAFVFPMLVFLLVGIYDFGMMFQRYEQLVNASREGARMAVSSGFSDPQYVKGRVDDFLTAAGLSPGLANVTVSNTKINGVGGGYGNPNAISVQVQYPYKYTFVGSIATLFGGAGKYTTITLTAVTVMRTEAAACVGSCSP